MTPPDRQAALAMIRWLHQQGRHEEARALERRLFTQRSDDDFVGLAIGIRATLIQ